MELKGGTLFAVLAGLPVKIESCNVALTQPTIKDIAAFGEDEYLFALQMLCRTESFIKRIKEGRSELEPFADFNILLMMLEQEKETFELIQLLLDFLFPDYSPKIEQGTINFYREDVPGICGQINARNFEEFQDCLNKVLMPKLSAPDEVDYKPANAAAEEIAKKLMAGRQKVKELKASTGKGGNDSLYASYISVLSIGLNLDINVLLSYTSFQLFDAFKRYFKKINDDFYMKISTTPMMDVSKMDKPESWLESLY